MSDSVNHPKHYNEGPVCPHCGKVVECITVIEGMDFCKGSAIKYLWREGKKGDRLEDLKKAQWYLQRLISQIEKEAKPC
jgi:hypothetical protein